MPFLSSPNGSWPDAYASVEADLNAALAHWEPRIEHIGSTSVPNMHAKPLIDVVVGVDAEAVDVPELRAAIEQLGFRQASHQSSLRRRIFVRRSGGLSVNLHVVPAGGEAWTQLLLTRDLLRQDPEVAASYVAMKQQADVDSGGDYRKYRARKEAWFAELTPRFAQFHRSRSGGPLDMAALNTGMAYSPVEILTPVTDPGSGIRVPLDGEWGTQGNPILGPGVTIRPEQGVNDGWAYAEDGGLVQEFLAPDGTYRIDVVASASPSPN